MRKTITTLKTTISGKNSNNTLVRNDYARYYGENMNLYKIANNEATFH